MRGTGTVALRAARRTGRRQCARPQAECRSRCAVGAAIGFGIVVTVRGSVQEKNITFRFRAGTDSGTEMSFSGQLDEKEAALNGTWSFVDDQGNKGGGTFTAKRR